MYCQNCGTLINEGSNVCENCKTIVSNAPEDMLVVQATPNTNYNAAPNNVIAKQNKVKDFLKKHCKVVMIVSGIISIIGLFIAIKLLVSGDISYYIKQYNECMDGYRESNMSSYSSGYLGSAFRGIADSFKELAGTWMKRIWGIIIKVIISGIIGIVNGILCLFSYKEYKAGK